MFFSQSNHHDINQVHFTLPLMGVYNTVFHQMNMFQTIFRHIHADPNGINPLDIIIIWIWKISFLLWGNHSTYIKNRPIQYIIPIWFVLLSFYIDNNLRQSIPANSSTVFTNIWASMLFWPSNLFALSSYCASLSVVRIVFLISVFKSISPFLQHS